MRNPSKHSRLLNSLKIGIGISLLATLLIWNDNWRRVIYIFASIRLVYLVPFFGITFALIGTSCVKWSLFLKEREIYIRLRRLVALYMTGKFFDNFFPGMFGGDLVRAYVLGRQIKSQTQSMASVFLERFTGLIALVVLGVGSFVFNHELREDPLVAVSIAFMGGGCMALLFVLWKYSWVTRFFKPSQRHSRLKKLFSKLGQFHEHIIFYKDKPLLVCKAMIYSFLFHFFAATNVYLGCLVIDAPCTLFQAVVLTPIILLITSLPLTPNSLGVWEWAFSIYLAQAGALPEQGLAVALMIRGKNIIVSLLGGVFFLTMRTPERHHAEVQEQDVVRITGS